MAKAHNFQNQSLQEALGADQEYRAAKAAFMQLVEKLSDEDRKVVRTFLSLYALRERNLLETSMSIPK